MDTSPSRRSARQATLVASFVYATIGCASDTEKTGIVISVSSNLRPPGDINSLAVTVTQNTTTKLEQTFALGAGSGLYQLPVKVALLPGDNLENPLTVDIAASLNQTQVVTRKLRLPFIPDERRNVQVNLDRGCARAGCSRFSTCIPQRGCVGPSIEADGSFAGANGPDCDCQHYFPMCVGARWRYKVCSPLDATGTTCYMKDWAIADWGVISTRNADLDSLSAKVEESDRMFGKDATIAFMQVRNSAIDRSRRWISRVGDEVRWERSEWFDNQWNRVIVRYDFPFRRRLDESQKTVGPFATPTHEYEQIEIKPGAKTELRNKFVDNWSVVDARDVLRFPKEWLDQHPLCQHRVDQQVGTDPTVTPPAPIVATYCFVRGVGKVYEVTEGIEEEILVEHQVRGCSESGP